MKRADSWQTAEIPGPKKALVITAPESIGEIVNRAKRPLLIVGKESANINLGKCTLIDYTIRIARKGKIPLVSTGNTLRQFVNQGYESAILVNLSDIAHLLTDSNWLGLDGLGSYDLLLFIGIHYSFGWNVLSALKHFAKTITVISLDRFYQPNATWSFPNLKPDEWIKSLTIIENKVKER